MASLMPSITNPTTSYALVNFLPFSVKPPQLPANGIHNNRCYRVSCNVSKSDQNRPKISRETSLGKLDRRNVLLGLGGLYGASNLTADRSTLAAPIVTPDPSLCEEAEFPPGTTPINCCPPYAEVIDYQLPPPTKVMRVRSAAQWASPDYLEKYERATALMKALPEDDPRNFMQQANIHCAYCSSAYEQIGYPNLRIDPHNSWLFLPFHRWYLYFYERILGKLIDDPTFALPFWNWDTPSGMQMPSIYTNPSSPLYDRLRNQRHLPPAPIDLNYYGVELGMSRKQLVKNNLCLMYRQMVSGSKLPVLFHGQPYRAGDQEDPGLGAIETAPHNTVHVWTGDPTQPNNEDMGAFYSAARDPIFYAHHSNLDRMWELWRTMRGGSRCDFTDPDWLDSSFVFYDENAQLVRVKTRDCLDTRMLGYVYGESDIPWLKARPTPRKQYKGEDVGSVDFPITLDHNSLQFMVKRPKKSRTEKEKKEKEEVLVLNGIEFEPSPFVKFDCYVNELDVAASGPDMTEFVGSFGFIPHMMEDGEEVHTKLMFGMNDVLKDLGAEDMEKLLVTLVHVAGGRPVSVDEVYIDYIPYENCKNA